MSRAPQPAARPRRGRQSVADPIRFCTTAARRRLPQPVRFARLAKPAPAGVPAEWLGLAGMVAAAAKTKEVAADRLQRYLARTR